MRRTLKSLLPAVLRDWRGFYFRGSTLTASEPTLGVLIDYQNIHLTARDLYAPIGTSARDTLVHPLRFAEQLLTIRASKANDPWLASAILTSVCVYRGTPSNRHQPDLYSASQRQRSEWTRDPRVSVHYRSLRYPPRWPAEPAREKGIDVLLAVELVSRAMNHEADVLVCATHDTDLEPALEMALSKGRCKIETAGWEGGRRLRVPGRKIWHTTLGASAFVESRDRRPY
ncbi:NYN domain-containing protein [Phaeacidiphilus oryzae]|uniref:NYN domain-containing protein n=1 Tax=Phaeacidiphilus oryzae TaxID=348818 RepID=UPI00389A7143